MKTALLYFISGSALGYLIAFVMSVTMSGVDGLIFLASTIAFGTMGAIFGMALKEKRLVSVGIPLITIFLVLHFSFVYTYIRVAGESDERMRAIDDNLKTAVLDVCRQGEVSKIGKDPSEIVFTDCGLINDELARDFCYDCFVSYFKVAGDEEGRKAACSEIEDKTITLYCD